MRGASWQSSMWLVRSSTYARKVLMCMPGLMGLIQKVEQASKQVGQSASDSAAQRATECAD